VLALVWAENGLSVISSSLGFLLVALACGTFVICALSPALPFSRVAVPGAAFLATMAYSIYLTHKLPLHWIQLAVAKYPVPAMVAYAMALISVLGIGSILFFVVERPFLRLRELEVFGKTKGNRQNSGPAASVK
jgi:peptidoglycan/LPS O-acetylase OafA/YrhL